MTPRPLGQTGLAVSRLGLGLAALGRPGYINVGHGDDLKHEYDVAAMEANCHAVLDAAWDCGVRYFDAARSYGKAEQFLASWLRSRNVAPEDAAIGSKWGYAYTADWRVDAEKHEVKEHSLDRLTVQFGESRAILGEHLDLYQIHSATLESGVLDNAAVLSELVRLKAGGMRVGLSATGPRQAETIRKAVGLKIDCQRLFDAVQATWNLLEPSAGTALAEAHDAGMGVIVKEAMANGRLTARNNRPEFAEKRTILESAAARLGCSLDALALAAVLAQPWADVVLSGAATVEQVRSNARALAVRWDGPMPAIVESADEYWDIRSRLSWN